MSEQEIPQIKANFNKCIDELKNGNFELKCINTEQSLEINDRQAEILCDYLERKIKNKKYRNFTHELTNDIYDTIRNLYHFLGSELGNEHFRNMFEHNCYRMIKIPSKDNKYNVLKKSGARLLNEYYESIYCPDTHRLSRKERENVFKKGGSYSTGLVCPFSKGDYSIFRFFEGRKYYDFPFGGMSHFEMEEHDRFEYQHEYSFVLVNNRNLYCLSKHISKKYIEICAGLGYMSFCLKTMFGRDPICVNDKKYDDSFLDIVISDGDEYLMKNNFDKTIDILLCWPPMEERTHEYKCIALQTVNNMLKGQRLFYNGAGKGGITGSEEFFEKLETDFTYNDKISDELILSYTSFPFVRDSWAVFTKK
jgi:hypothetical protein